VAGQLGCTTGLVEGEVGSNRVHYKERERSFDVLRLSYQVEKK
jgi:hypothetical protein